MKHYSWSSIDHNNPSQEYICCIANVLLFSQISFIPNHSDHSQKDIKLWRFPNSSGEGISATVHMFLTKF